MVANVCAPNKVKVDALVVSKLVSNIRNFCCLGYNKRPKSNLASCEMLPYFYKAIKKVCAVTERVVVGFTTAWFWYLVLIK